MVEKSDNVKDSSKLKFYTVLVHEELYAKWRIVITTCSENCRRLPKNERRFPLLGNGPSSDLVEMFFLEYASKFSNSTQYRQHNKDFGQYQETYVVSCLLPAAVKICAFSW